MTPQIIAVTHLKGGTGKTTSTAYLAHAFAQLSRRVLVVDADPQRSLSDWAELAEWEIPTVALPTKQLHRRLRGIPGWARYDVVIIDTPPYYPQEGEDPDAAPPPGIVHSALKAADQIVVPMAPTTMDLRRVRATLKAIAASGHPPGDVRFLLNRKVNRAESTDAIRAVLVGGGSQVFQTDIKRLEVIAQGMGAPIPKQLHGYLSAALELEKMK